MANNVTIGTIGVDSAADNGKFVKYDSTTNTLVMDTPAGSGDVSKVGTPADNQIGVWTGDGTIEGTSGLTYDGSNLLLTGDIGATASRITKGWFTDLTVTNAIAGSVTGNAGTVTNATLTTALTVNTGSLTLTANADNTSVLTIGSGAVSVSGSNTGDQDLSGLASKALDNLASVAINTTLVSDTDNTDALGTSAIAWSDLFLGSGAVITFNSAPSTADVTLTHSANALTMAGGTLFLTNNYLQLGPTSYPVSSYPATTNAYLVVDKGATAADSSLVLRDQGAARAEIGLVGDNNIRFKTVTGTYGSETFTDRMMIDASTGYVAIGNTSSPDAPLHVYGNSGTVGMFLGEVGAGRHNLELYYDFNNDKSIIQSIHRGTAYKTLEIDALNTQFWQGSGSTALIATMDSTGLVFESGKVIELGHATDTTLSRASAGVLAVEGKVVPTTLSKSITVESPTSSEDISMFFTNQAITVTEIRAVLVGSATPSVTWTIRHGTDRSAAGAEVVTSGTTTTSTTTGSDVTSFNDATIVADSFVWLETTAQSGTVDELNITIFYRQDA